MSISLVRMDPDCRPDVWVALRSAEHVAPLALARGYVQETGNAPRSGAGEHFLLTLDKAGIIQVAVAIDQPHFAASAGSSSSSSRGKRGCGCAMGCPPLPLSISVRSLSADSGITGATAWVSRRTATTSVPRTAAMRSGSVLRRVHGAWAST